MVESPINAAQPGRGLLIDNNLIRCPRGARTMRKTRARRLVILALSALYLPAYVQAGKLSSIRHGQLMWGMHLARSLLALRRHARTAAASLLVALAERALDGADRLTQQSKAEPPIPEPVPEYNIALDEYGRVEFISREQ